jgi:LacI family fructose operon transcriptional repressor
MPSRKERSSLPTIQSVAKHAGVSPATVSRVLNNYPFIRDEVRQRVLQAIAELGYEPNRVAQRLRSSSSRSIGIMVTDITNPFISTIMAIIEASFFEKGFTVLMCNTTASIQKELDYLSLMETEEVDGLAIVPTSEDVPRILELAEGGMPIVVIDRRMKSDHLDVVLADNIAGARSAVEHLIQSGHQRIGHIGGPLRSTSGRERHQGYMQAMQNAGITPSPEWVRMGDHLYEGGYEHTADLLKTSPELTAVFVENNMMSLGAMNALHDAGVRIPQDMSIIGFDDMPWSKALNPPMTVVAQPTIEIGQTAARLLMERIEQPDLPSRTEVLPTSLIIRASCRTLE